MKATHRGTAPIKRFAIGDASLKGSVVVIYKILTDEQWQSLRAQGRFAGAPIDMADGYIHFSTAAQLRETLEKHFKAVTGLMLAAVDCEPLGNGLKWEPSRGGDRFPHLYRMLFLTEVLWVAPLTLDSKGCHQLPTRMNASGDTVSK